MICLEWLCCFFFQAEDGIRDLVRSRGLGDVYKRQVLAGSLYFLAAALMAYRYIHTSWLQITGFLLLCTHVYLLDFFSLCRGYGMVSCGMIWGAYTIMRYSELLRFRWVLACVLILFLSVVSNFTAVLPFLSMGLVWFGVVVIQKRYALLVKHGFVWLLSSGLLSMLLTYPFRIFRSEGELEWGSKNLWVLSTDLAGNLFYGVQYGLDNAASLLVFTFVLLLCLAALFVLMSHSLNSKRPMFLSLGLLVINFAVIYVYQKLTGSSMPLGRKSVYLIPIIFSPLALVLGFVKPKIGGFLVGVLVSVLLLRYAA